MSDPHFTWLHLTDLHAGISLGKSEWNGAEYSVLKDLEGLIRRSGLRIDLIIFTGDLTQKATDDDFKNLDDVLARIRRKIEDCGAGTPPFIAVPGNHDLQRLPADAAQAEMLRDFAANATVRPQFWADKKDEAYRPAVVRAFAAWQQWTEKTIDWNQFEEVQRTSAELPGEFALSFCKQGFRIGILGLNTAATQLAAGQYHGKLTMNGKQASSLVGRVHEWSAKHDANLLLTHHAPDWLDEVGEKAYRNDVAHPDWFDFHLCGHAHQQVRRATQIGGTAQLPLLLGRSLFGLDEFVNQESTPVKRLFGYSIGQITFGESRMFRIWARADQNKQSGTTTVEADHTEAKLEADEGTPAKDIGPSRRVDRQPALALSAHFVPTGWIVVDTGFLNSLPPLRDEEVIRYFDGAVPTWRHAIADAIPRRKETKGLTNSLSLLRDAHDECSITVVRAAGGEGKTTLLLQVAADAARSEAWTVLWRLKPDGGLAAHDVALLDEHRKWLLVSDDAESLVKELQAVATQLHDKGRTNVHFLLAARDTDWINSNGNLTALASRLKVQPNVGLHGIDFADAKAIVNAWGAHGKAGLRELASRTKRKEQVTALVHATRADSGDAEADSFFGALLAVRLGVSGLRAHVAEMMTRLKEMQIQGSENTLFDALLYVAVCHNIALSDKDESVKALGIDEGVLADLLSVPREWVHTRVVVRLGEEAAAVRGGGGVFTRHRKVAEAILVTAEDTFMIDVGEVWARLVQQTIETARARRVTDIFKAIVHAGPRLQRALPVQLLESRRKSIAIAAAQASVRFKFEWLGCVVDLGKTFRIAEMYDEAVGVFRSELKNARSKADYSRIIRGYWHEWGTCEGLVKTASTSGVSDAWIQGIALSDYLGQFEITLEQVKLTCSGLGVAFGKMIGKEPTCPFAMGRRAVAYLGWLSNPDPTAIEYFQKYDRLADQARTPKPKDAVEAIRWLATGVSKAGSMVSDEFLSTLAVPNQISFNQLEALLGSAERLERAG